jgi:hypothetical protein
MRLQISASPKDVKKPYSHLEPIIACLLSAGNELSNSLPEFSLEGNGFYMDRDGWKCDLRKPIDFALIRAKFDLPLSIMLSEKSNSVLCKNTWVEIRGSKV